MGADNAELKPCPFCGSAAVSIGRARIRTRMATLGAWFYYGQCHNCGANGPQSDANGFFYMTPAPAVAEWNRRAEVCAR